MIKIVMDSAAGIGAGEAKALGITMLPMEITFGDTTYLDGVDLQPEHFYEMLVESNELPKTSLVNEYRWGECFEEELKSCDEVVAITLSSKLSGTYAAAKNAAARFAGKVFVVDSLNATAGERLLCEYALRLVKEGRSAQEIADELDEKKKKINVMAVIATLEYLKKGGRISAAVALAGAVFSIKPVIAVVDGEVKVVGKAIGSKKGNNLLNKLVEEKGGIDFSMPYSTVWSGMDGSALDKYITDSAALWHGKTEALPRHILSATIGTHIGPGAVGVAFFSK